MNLLIKGGRVIDPGQKIDGVLDLLCAGDKVVRLGKNITPDKGIRVIDAGGLIVSPGFIDGHCHLREPGREDEETIKSGADSAASGGYTTILAMPNTNPCIDNGFLVAFVLNKGKETPISVLPIGAITRNRQGKELTEMVDLAKNGAAAFSDDGRCVADSQVLRRALEYARMVNRPVIDHPEDSALAREGVINEGKLATLLGLTAIPKEAEEVAVFRDIAVASLTRGHLHLAHLTTAGSISLLRQAKRSGFPVTAEVTFHHLTLTEEAVKGYNTSAKVSPPLRTEEDVRALKVAVRDGTVDIIVTDHAPHSREEKETDFDSAAFGMLGFETALPLLLRLTKEIPLNQLIACLTVRPARVFGLSDRGTLKKGLRADVTVFDPKAEWTLTTDNIKSLSQNTPFLNQKMAGRVVYTVSSGKVVVDRSKYGFSIP
ncbi:MAG: dihydroorotase [Candidatus Omnitrophota bacterium]